MKTIYFCLSFILIFTISCSSGDKNQTGTSGSKTNQGIITDDSLLTLVQYRTFQYFWDGAEPNSGMARERFHVDGIYPENDMNVVTTGGSGFGVMAILESWIGGTEAGNAIADVLFGDINPEKPFEKFKSNYLDVPNTPLYPFGYGLSYTTFSYSDIKINKTEFQKEDQIIATAEIRNTGDKDGEEIVQLYIHDLVGDVTRPVKELKGFKKILVKKGETVTVTFNVSTSELSYYHQNMSYSLDPGDFELFIGPNSSEGLVSRFSVL